MSRRAYYLQRERIFSNRAQFAGLCFLLRLFRPFFFLVYSAMFTKSHIMCVWLGFRVFRFQLMLTDSPDLPWSERLPIRNIEHGMFAKSKHTFWFKDLYLELFLTYLEKIPILLILGANRSLIGFSNFIRGSPGHAHFISA